VAARPTTTTFRFNAGREEVNHMDRYETPGEGGEEGGGSEGGGGEEGGGEE
jgi:hypothetical protein